MRTRAALIDGGLRLAEEMGLAGVSVNVLVAELGVSKGTFFHHFGSRANYLLALHREFHERLEKVMVAAVVDHPPGRDHLLAGTHAYLDACLRDRGVKALLLEARAEPLIIGEVSARNARNAGLAEPDFRALGWRHPREGAALWVGLVAEAALLELHAGGRRQSVRDALRQFIERAAADDDIPG
ncbi:TetR/AcrR family transcriptional regulator [Nocardia seriolae]|uniref:TetR/AcrR family transcriptional regulator n=1 Tax=Nocardia seriolae TaxID=37332 RepID=UPI001D16719F|nr:TetR/AcrR family transcriptional regulator [Nocardia seriolae]WKY50987.1 TetR/AcrR family transcriptional regulator [Nocardia seriolae]WNJ57638.1 TetR/AcrR family transcriptional regulator [Nocardia seriolae]